MGNRREVQVRQPKKSAEQIEAEKMFLAQMRGEGPSVAGEQLKMGIDEATKRGLALANSARGGTAGLAQRAAIQQAGDMQSQVAGQTAALRAGEAMGAQQALQQGGLQEQGFQTSLEAARMQAQQQADAARSGLIGKIVGGILTGGASAGAAALSDEDAKKDIRNGDAKVQEFLDAISAHEYSYKGGDGSRRVSPMAQEMEESEMGEHMVSDTPAGKMVDYGKSFGTMMAAAAQMNKRLKALESAQGSKKAKKMANGGMVEGKAMTKGDSVKNDKVPVMLSPGEIVVPRTVAKKGTKEILTFVEGLKAKKRIRK